ncbi:MAG: T9SS type A sorting domain-containing protein [Balneolia bacterium]|nr:T9SS type A sorting domain-containing protein [Balneolia bacterium]
MRYSTIISCTFLVSLCLVFSAQAQLSPQPVECVDGFGPGSIEYKIIDQVFHERATPADSWTALPLPDDPPEQLVPRGASNGYLVYANLVRDWVEEKMYATFYYSTDNGESWNTYGYENNDVYASATTFGIAGPYLGLRFSSDTFFSWQNSRWLNLETGEVSLNGDFWVSKFISNPSSNGFILFADYEGMAGKAGENLHSPYFSASSVYEFNSSLELRDTYVVFEPMDFWDEETGGYQELLTHRVYHLDDRSLAATDAGLFVRHEGSSEWILQENSLFTHMRDVYFYNGGLYALAWDAASEATSEVFLIRSTDKGESWAVDTIFENTTGAGDFIVHNGDLRFRVGSSCYVLSGGTSIPPEQDQIPSDITLYQNYPNPFNPSTIISFALPESGHVSLRVYNSVGQQVAVLANGVRSEGRHDVTFDASNLASGLYFYSIHFDDLSKTRTMLLIK